MHSTVVKAVSVTGLVLLVAGGFYVSYENLHTFAAEHGKNAYRAIVVALSVDLLTLLGLLVALTYPSLWARAAFVTGLITTAVANGLVGWDASAFFGVAVALWPVVSMELAYKVVLTLILNPAGTKATEPLVHTDPDPEPPDPRVEPPEPETEPALSPADPRTEPSLSLVGPEGEPLAPSSGPAQAKAQRVAQVRDLLAQSPSLTAQQVADSLDCSLSSGKRYLRQARSA